MKAEFAELITPFQGRLNELSTNPQALAAAHQ
jgi:hypothetical protein